MKSKTLKTAIFIVLINLTPKLSAQTCEDRFVNCKSMVIESLKNNDTNSTKALSDELYQMAICDGNLVIKFNNWYGNFIENYKTNMEQEINNLKSEKEQLKQTANQLNTNAWQNASKTFQQNANQIQYNRNQKAKSSQAYSCDDCPAGTLRTVR